MVWSTIYDTEESPKEIFHPSPPQQLRARAANSFLDHSCLLDINSIPALARLTGIVCTIGRSCTDPATIERMLETGMNIARLNCCFGTHSTRTEEITNIRTAVENYSKRLGLTYPVAIAMDIKGPEIRLGYVDGGATAEVKLNKGDLIKLTTDKAYYEKGSASVMYIDYDNIYKVIQFGSRIYVDDGLISLTCTNVQGSVITCIIDNDAVLAGGKGVNLPGTELDLPTVSPKDKDDIMFGLENGVDMIFASFIRNAAAVKEIRNILGARGEKIKIISKIENQQGLKNIDEIIKVSDGILVGRGDLGIEIPVEKLFLAQKSMIAKCNVAGKPVICSNQMLFSMGNHPRPTRSECLDVANAVLDGSDCLMLNETADGKYPIEIILTMAKICKEAESALWHKKLFTELVDKVVPPLEPSHAAAIAAVEAASKCLAAVIITITTSGKSAVLLSRYRPNCPIIAVSRNEQTTRQLNLCRGILPLYYPTERLDDWIKDVETRISFAISFAKWRGFIRAGDPVIAVHGSRRGSGYTDTMRILYVTKPPERGDPCGDHCD